MEPNELLEAWENGVALGDAWWAFADTRNKKRFRELQQAASPADLAPHMGFRHALEEEVIGRLCSGELQAFGIEFGSAGEPIAIPKNYFWKGAEINLDNDTVAALGRKFGQARVQGNPEPVAEALPGVVAIDPQQIPAEVKLPNKLRAVPDEPEYPAVIHVSKAAAEPPPSDAGPRENIKRAQRGRPSKTPEIELAIDILLEKGVGLAKLPRPQAMAEIRNCAADELNSDVNIGFSDPVLERVLFRRFGPRR
jgi:hypothetical protein